MPKSPSLLAAPPSRVRATMFAMGPAFVAAIAYVDPGNVAANLTAGARYGYLLLWVLVLANGIAVLVQYQSAKLGIVTGQSLPEILGERLKTGPRRVYWIQAELVAGATDIAEVLGGAIALYLLFGVPLLLGGLIVGLASMGLLLLQTHRSQRSFEAVIITLLGVIVIGFMSGLFFSGMNPAEAVAGIVPRFEGTDSVLLATSMLGATVMPHVIYLHSALARDRHGVTTDPVRIRSLLRSTRWDVGGALFVAGAVNISMLLLAAAALRGVEGTDSIEGAHAAVVATLGPAIGVIFAIGLLASGLASTSVGTYAGSSIMGGLLKLKVPLLLRRAITLIPALVVLAIGFDPTRALVLSQVVLSFGIPFALIPLVWFASSRKLMGDFVNRPWLRWSGWISAGAITVLNILLIVLVASGN
ncbi:MAG: Nramp family divalent metal transporter [Rhodoglobus sp.]|uniref:Nramp family divalent metal transporter n=1 Tax=Salinibacterium sp. G-O1 TaxID=3046208 RepID=UPI0024B96686|nr:Nramp family divalent metal transporter [Salinibacterium sp. G-O1]MDJ0334546.1 Nramp family divalent metal transporter [Salinibacterium sp. G-O1]